MKCQFCGNPAMVHLTDIIQKKKRELHLCEECAREQKLIPESQHEISIPALLHFLTGQLARPQGKLARLACPHCGMKYEQFRAQGRLGCPRDYQVFQAALEPLLERIHHGTRHAGKMPALHQGDVLDVQRRALREQLNQAVRDERYEDAARLRDQLRNLDATDESR